MTEATLQDTLQIVFDADGKGSRVVTSIAVPAGGLIATITGHRHVSAPSRYTVQESIDGHIDDLGPLTYLNHSCDPNVFIDTANLAVTALRDVETGEELTFFYPSTEWHMAEPFQCMCGSAACLGMVTGAESLSDDVLSRYQVNEHIATLRRAFNPAG